MWLGLRRWRDVIALAAAGILQKNIGQLLCNCRFLFLRLLRKGFSYPQKQISIAIPCDRYSSAERGGFEPPVQ